MEEFNNNDLIGINPEIINNSSLTPEEKRLLLNKLSESDIKGSLGCFVVYIIILFAGIMWLTHKWLLFSSGYGALILLGKAVIVFFFIVLFKLGEMFRSGDGAGYKMKKDWRRPILYFRAFKDDGSPQIDEIKISIMPSQMFTFKYSIQNEVKRKLDKHGPLIALSGIGEMNEESFGGPGLLSRAKEDKWKKIAKALLKVSSGTVFIVGEVSDHIIWELKKSSEIVPWEYVFFFIPQNISTHTLLKYAASVEVIFNCKFQITNYITSWYTPSCFVGFLNGNFKILEEPERIFEERF